MEEKEWDLLAIHTLPIGEESYALNALNGWNEELTQCTSHADADAFQKELAGRKHPLHDEGVGSQLAGPTEIDLQHSAMEATSCPICNAELTCRILIVLACC